LLAPPWVTSLLFVLFSPYWCCLLLFVRTPFLLAGPLTAFTLEQILPLSFIRTEVADRIPFFFSLLFFFFEMIFPLLALVSSSLRVPRLVSFPVVTIFPPRFRPFFSWVFHSAPSNMFSTTIMFPHPFLVRILPPCSPPGIPPTIERFPPPLISSSPH